MRHASIRELRSHTKELLDAVERGEEVLITSHGKGCAKIVPLSEEKVIESKVFGLWADNFKVKNVKAFVNAVRKPRHVFD